MVPNLIILLVAGRENTGGSRGLGISPVKVFFFIVFGDAKLVIKLSKNLVFSE